MPVSAISLELAHAQFRAAWVNTHPIGRDVEKPTDVKSLYHYLRVYQVEDDRNRTSILTGNFGLKESLFFTHDLTSCAEYTHTLPFTTLNGALALCVVTGLMDPRPHGWKVDQHRTNYRYKKNGLDIRDSTAVFTKAARPVCGIFKNLSAVENEVLKRLNAYATYIPRAHSAGLDFWRFFRKRMAHYGIATSELDAAQELLQLPDLDPDMREYLDGMVAYRNTPS